MSASGLARDVRADRASASTLMAALTGAAACAAATIAFWVSAASATNRANAAADLAALAAADAARALTAGLPCELAATLAQKNGAILTSCTLEPPGTIVRVRVAVPLPGPLSFLGPARGKARAGPPEYAPRGGSSPARVRPRDRSQFAVVSYLARSREPTPVCFGLAPIGPQWRAHPGASARPAMSAGPGVVS